MEQVKAEPVAWMIWKEHEPHHGKDLEWRPMTAADKANGWTETPLYANPQPAAVDGLVEALLRVSTERMIAVLVAVDHYNTTNGTAIVGLGLRELAIQIAANRQALAQIERKPEDGK